MHLPSLVLFDLASLLNLSPFHVTLVHLTRYMILLPAIVPLPISRKECDVRLIRTWAKAADMRGVPTT